LCPPTSSWRTANPLAHGAWAGSRGTWPGPVHRVDAGRLGHRDHRAAIRIGAGRHVPQPSRGVPGRFDVTGGRVCRPAQGDRPRLLVELVHIRVASARSASCPLRAQRAGKVVGSVSAPTAPGRRANRQSGPSAIATPTHPAARFPLNASAWRRPEALPVLAPRRTAIRRHPTIAVKTLCDD